MLVSWPRLSHNGSGLSHVMTFYTCLDNKGDVIARCQTEEEIVVLRRMGRPIAEVKQMRHEEAVVCSLTGSPSDYTEEY